MNPQERYRHSKRVTLIGALINIALGCLKLTGGFFYHSQALIADGIHSFSDLFTDMMVLFASKYGSQDADESHPYGHQRIETAATLMLAVLLILAGIGISWEAVNEIIHSHEKPEWYALPIALFSIVANELSFHYTHYVGKKIQSNLLIANAWHHRSDVASSIIVALGLLGTLFGFAYFDAVAAILVGIMIIKMGINYGWNSVKELVDAAVDPETFTKIETMIQQVGGVKKIHQLRSRLMGGKILIDVHILVAPYLSVSEGHYIAQQVHYALINRLERVRDVIVHVDPEDDETSQPSLHLPSRNALQQQLLFTWKQEFPIIHDWTLHYLDGKITIDLICQRDRSQWALLRERINTDVRSFKDINKVRLLTLETLD